jgi:hypothetical protein
MRNFIGRGNFTWFIGVVEDRDDPSQLGRVRVRCFGWHTDDKGSIPTNQLPWAIPVNPVQSASVSGVGHSPTGLVEGSWVVGFFVDGERAQEPMILGSIYGAPTSFADPSMGFNDPIGIFPREINETDVSRAARESANSHPSRITKNRSRINPDGSAKQFFTATPPRVTSVAPDRQSAYYANTSWSEPEISDGIVPDYPFNHVRETEGGHLEEFDDTEGGKRYHRFHPAGSFEEIVDDGSRIIKVVGEDYEMYLDGKNIFVDGNINMTVTGDKRELIQGNYHLEVEGDMTMDLKQSLQTKINFNQETEVGRSRSTNIGQSDNLTIVSGDQNLNIITGNRLDNIAKNDLKTVGVNNTTIVSGNTASFTGVNYRHTNIGTMTQIVNGNFVKTLNANETVTITGTKTETAATISATYGDGTITVTGGDVVASDISLNSHTHGGVVGGVASTGGPE